MMKRVLCVIIGLVFLSGCALSTIRAPRKKATPKKKAFIEKPLFKAKPRGQRKEEILSTKEEILRVDDEYIK